jgi:hypothetical protein
MTAGPRLAAVEVTLQVFQRQLDAGRAAVNDGNQRRTVAFAGSGDSEQLAVGIAGHAGGSEDVQKLKRASIRRLMAQFILEPYSFARVQLALYS